MKPRLREFVLDSLPASSHKGGKFFFKIWAEVSVSAAFDK